MSEEVDGSPPELGEQHQKCLSWMPWLSFPLRLGGGRPLQETVRAPRGFESSSDLIDARASSRGCRRPPRARPGDLPGDPAEDARLT
jgi:hypothetical protein